MNQSKLRELAKAADRDGLTLQWSMRHLIDKLDRMQQRIAQQGNRNSRAAETDAQMLQLESEALAMVLTAVLKTYPLDATLSLD